MNDFPSQKEVERIKKMYPKGTRILIERMNDPYHPIERVTKGTVDYVDDVGTLHCTFDNGRCQGIVTNTDIFHVIDRLNVPIAERYAYLLGSAIDGNKRLGNCNEENSRKVKQLIGGCQGQRVYAPDGLAVTQCSGSGGMGGKTGLYLIDMNYPPTLTEKARCITARQDSGVSKHKGEHSAVFCDLNENPQITENARCLHTRMDIGVGKGSHRGERSGVLVEDGPRAILNPFKEEVYQNGRRVKEPNEPMFTLTVVDRHGIVHQGRIRRLMPIECWRLQGFTTEQFRKVEAAGLSAATLR